VIYYNKKRLIGPLFLSRDIVYLLRKNIKTKRLSNKLDYKKLRLLKIKRKIGLINYKLSLPYIIKIYLIFYILLLEKALLNAIENKTNNIEPLEE
jgi:hypothetical protein